MTVEKENNKMQIYWQALQKDQIWMQFKPFNKLISGSGKHNESLKKGGGGVNRGLRLTNAQIITGKSLEIWRGKRPQIEEQTPHSSRLTHSNPHPGALTQRKWCGREVGRFWWNGAANTHSNVPSCLPPSSVDIYCSFCVRFFFLCELRSHISLCVCVCARLWTKASLVIHLCVFNHCEEKATFYLSELNPDHMATPSPL